MPGDESAGERTEDATPRRQQKEREQGRVAKSKDLSAALILLAAMFLLRYGGYEMLRWLYTGMQRIIAVEIATCAVPKGIEIVPHAHDWMLWALQATGPFLLGMFLVALLVSYAQSGFLFSWEPVMPNLNKLNPINGAKRVFGLRGVMTLVLNLLKLVCVVTVVYLTLRVDIPAATHLSQMQPGQMLWQSANAVVTLGTRLALLFLVLGILDYGYQLYQYHQDMRMTKQEVKEEMKEVDGDPQIKARRRQIQRQLAMQRMMQEVPQAEVVVRNPTHFAVAIKYTPQMAAPEVVAKGADLMAKRIIDIAIKSGVPVWQAPPLARQLYRLEIGDTIPAALFPALAEVLAHVLKGEKLAKYRNAMSGEAA